MKCKITAEDLRNLLHYDPETGVFTRLVSTGGRYGARAGSVAGTLHPDGRVMISVRSRLYKAHRLAWLYMTGEWPEQDVLHRNHRSDDNRWSNLFEGRSEEHRDHQRRTPEREAMLKGGAREAERVVSIDMLRERVRYDAETGELRWADSVPESSFIDARAAKIWHTKFAGKVVSKSRHGYVVVAVSVELKTYYLQGHRVAWALMTARWPEHQIDHINRSPSDNRWCNLREATPQQNVWNRGKSVRNKSGVTGVHRSKQSGRWVAQIANGSNRRTLGSFETLAEAATARHRAEDATRGQFVPIE